jgi:site-specific DNA-methyltransferase (adenine-specific)/adenine-specific DNA-methyltransferase
MPKRGATEEAGGSGPVAELHFGDCVEGMRRLPAASVDLVIADPPYDIGVQGSGWDTVPHYLQWSRTWLAEAERVLRPGGQLFVYGSPAKLWISRLKIIAADEFRFDFKQHISWCYKQGGDSRFAGMVQYAVRMEHLEWFVKPVAAADADAHTFNALEAAELYTLEERAEALAKGVGRVTEESLDRGRPPRNWVEIPRENSRSIERKYGAHPSMKPLKLCERIVAVHSNKGDCVLIPFGGSGSEAVAASKLMRRVLCYESNQTYHDIISRRLAGHGVRVLGSAPAPEPLGPPPSTPADAGLERCGTFTSGYRGVFRHGQHFVAKIHLQGKLVYIGKFNDAVDAAVAYRARAVVEGLIQPLAALPPTAGIEAEPTPDGQLAQPANGEQGLAQVAPSGALEQDKPAPKKRGRPRKQPAADQAHGRIPLATAMPPQLAWMPQPTAGGATATLTQCAFQGMGLLVPARKMGFVVATPIACPSLPHLGSSVPHLETAAHTSRGVDSTPAWADPAQALLRGRTL